MWQRTLGSKLVFVLRQFTLRLDCWNITTLELHACGIRGIDRGNAQKLANVLARSTSLSTLDLSYNNWCLPSCDVQWQQLFVPNSPYLLEYDKDPKSIPDDKTALYEEFHRETKENADNLVHMLSHSSCLTDLDLNGNNCGQYLGTESFTRVLTSSPHLRYLDLSKNEMHTIGEEILGGLFPQA